MSSLGPDDRRDDADDVDARFADLVASLDDVAEIDDAAATDASARVEPTDDEPGRGNGPGLTYPVAPWVAAGPSDWDATAQIDGAEELVDGLDTFVPPDPGPVMGNDPLVTMAWLAATGIPALCFVLFLFWRTAPPVIFQAGGIVCLAGVAVLLWRMPARRDPDDTDPAEAELAPEAVPTQGEV